jgi:hypothetical protein
MEAPPTTACKHCWHRSPFHHAIQNHADIRCCHCGTDKCVRLRAEAPPGHGPHLPQSEWRFVVDGDQ